MAVLGESGGGLTLYESKDAWFESPIQRFYH